MFLQKKKKKLNLGTLMMRHMSISTHTRPTHHVPWVRGDDMPHIGLCSLPAWLFLSCPAAPHFPLLFLPCLLRGGKCHEEQKKTLESSPALFWQQPCSICGLRLQLRCILACFFSMQSELRGLFYMQGIDQTLRHLVQYVPRPADDERMYFVRSIWTW